MGHWLFGLDAQNDGATEVRFEWLSAPSGDQLFWLLVALAAAFTMIWLFYRWEAARIGFIRRSTLALLRMSIVVATIIMLFEPIAVFTKQVLLPSHLLVLVDTSASMELQDAWKDQQAAESVRQRLQLTGELSSQTRLALASQALRTGLLQRLTQQGDRVIHVHSFAERLDLDPRAVIDGTDDVKELDLRSTKLTGRNTAIGAALAQSRMAYRGMPTAGILLITDGQSNSGESPESIVAARTDNSTAVNVLALGTEQGPSNAAIVKLEANRVAFVRDINTFDVVLQSRGLANASATVVAETRRAGESWKEIGRQTVELNDNGEIDNLTFSFREDTPGKLEVRARLELNEKELTQDDNIAGAEIELIPQQLRVLFIAGSTFPEVQFVRNTFIRDKGVDISTWNQSAEEGYEHPGDIPIRRLPMTAAELNEYHCVILYDPDPTKWPSSFSQLLEDFVAFGGGGMIYIAGEMQSEKSFRNQQDPGMSWLQLLPVVREPGLFQSEVRMKLSARNAWRLQITPSGRNDPVFRFSTDPEENSRILRSLPGMYWHFPVTRAKAGATVLARHGDPRMRNEFGPEVLLATHRVGPGRVYFVGFDSTYRWRYVDEQTFDGFWARMVDRAGRTKQLGGGYPFRLRTDKLTYEPGETARISATLIQHLAEEHDIDMVQAEIEHADDPPIQIVLEPSGRESEFVATFPVESPGTYLIRAWTGERGPDDKVKTVTQQFQVDLPNAEYEKPTLDRGRLEQIARATGGSVFGLEDIDRIPAAFEIGKVQKLQEERREIWNAPFLFGFILFAITLEWILRKRFQLV